VVWSQAHFFVELAEHRLLRRLAVFDAALGNCQEWVRMRLPQKDLVALIEQDDADVGPKAFSVEHNQLQIFN
jgi:hypothetical protein